jgi:hypothetical protein
MRLFIILFIVGIQLLLGTVSRAQAQSTNVLTVIKEIEKESAWKFLYREALVVDIKIPSKEYTIGELEQELNKASIGLHIDEQRNKILLFKSTSTPTSTSLSVQGYIVDASSGERLPYSTIAWYKDGQITGVNSDEQGRFAINIESSQPEVTLLFSYVGYQTEQVQLNTEDRTNWTDLTVRLTTRRYTGKEIVVKGTSLFSPADTVYQSLIKTGSFSPLGDNNAIQSLQSLPSVLSGPAVNDGLNVRGSSSDGFRVILDGLTMYNQSHLFGLLDGLNAHILRSSGFFYDVTPAQFRAPLGGILSYTTKTGRLQNYNSSVGFSNTAISTTLEGPLVKGKSSFIVSGRHSYIDDIDWMNNQNIIKYGLDIDRPFSFKADTIAKYFNRNLNLLSTDASFYDVHGKMYTEFKNGGQLSLSGYLGHDEALQEYERGPKNNRFQFETSNEWSNKLLNLHLTLPLANNASSLTSIGFTDYYASYFKEDYRSQRVETTNGNRTIIRLEIRPLSLENDLQEFNASQRFHYLTSFGSFELGSSYSDFQLEYTELRLENRSFRSKRTSQLLDLFTQLDFNQIENAQLNIGGRLHYFSNGQYLKWSPRIKAQLFPESNFSFGLGYSTNYQFLHRLDFLTINSTDFWIMSNEEQPPSSVDYYTINFRVRPSPYYYFQIEGYVKHFDNLRIHTLSEGAISASFSEAEAPYLFNNTGEGKGLEVLHKFTHRKGSVAATYTLSSIELENIMLNEGAPFHPDYDRTHQLTVMNDFTIGEGWKLFSSWTYATGTPNALAILRDESESRIGDYSRVDFSLTYTYQKNFEERFEAAFSVYNVLNRNNPWYSQVIGGVSTVSDDIVTGSASVYDLGIQPSFKITIHL